MNWSPFRLIAALALMASFGACLAHGQITSPGTLRITIPKRSSPTLVQRLNREGVKAVEKHDYAAAAGFFYKAYLYDPADPFTLNNLGYISELQGDLEHAEKFYKLAAEQGCNATIDLSNVERLQGEPMQTALASIQDTPMRVNRINVDAVGLLKENRGAEAASLLQQAVSIDPHDPFTLNNLGAAEEATGDYRGALKYYTAAADLRSHDVIVVTQDPSFRGKPISETAEANAMRVEGQLQGTGSTEIESADLNRRGVMAENENDWPAARQYFMRAYTLDPRDAFSLNNRGYVAERDGDLESAEFFYQKALQAAGSNLRVGLATRHFEEGKPLFQVAGESSQNVDGALDIYSQQRRRETGPVELTPRDSGAGASEQAPASPNAAPLPVPNQQGPR